MEIIEPSVEIIYPSKKDFENYPMWIEKFGRTCYKSEDRISEGSAHKFVKMILKRGHESVLEHLSITARIICDRSTSHQLVRHRIAAYSQESQRYVRYDGSGIQVICPPKISKAGDKTFFSWKYSIKKSEKAYRDLISLGIPSEDARSVLPNAVKTEVITTFNVRQWRHVFDMRCDSHAQWQIREIMTQVLTELYELCPVLFGDKAEKFGIRKTIISEKPLPVKDETHTA